MQHGKYRFVASFLALPLLLYVVFVISPYLQAFYISLTGWSGFTASQPFVGLSNYVQLFQDPIFWKALAHNGLILLVVPLVTLGLAMFFATMLNVAGGQAGSAVAGVRGSGFYRVVYFFPHVLPLVIAGILWTFIYNPRIGLLNSVLRAVGLDALAHSWLGNPNTALWAVMGVLVWTATGFYVVLFTAGMQAIPKSFYEAALIDGAGRLTTLRRITLPLMRETIQVAYVYLGILALDMFTIVQVMTPGGGPDNSTSVIAQYLYTSAFEDSQFGYASAIGVTLCLLTLALAALTFRVTNRERIEY